MEERSPPAAGKARKLSSTSSSLRALSLTPARLTSDQTYVVQIPRDQVYRVPPPENARIVENHRKPDSQKSKNRFTCCCWILSALLGLGIFIGIVMLTIHMLYIPKAPKFTLTNILFKNVTTPPSSGHGQKNNNNNVHPQFEIDLKIVNVNERMDVAFGNGNNGKATLVFKKQEIGHGKYPSISQKPEDSTNVHFNLDIGKLSGDIQKSLADESKPVPISLSIHAPMEITSWAKSLKKDMTVTCDFDVESLTKKSMIKYEKCYTDL